MIRKAGIILAVFLITGALFAQETVKTLTLSADLKAASTPRIVRNGFQHVWLVVFRQQGSPSKLVGRLITSDGVLKPAKTLAKGLSSAIGSFDVFYDSVKYTYLIAFETSKGLQVQLLKGTLAKSGVASLIEGGISGTNPRLAFDPNSKKFLILWISTQNGVPGKVLNIQLIDETGKPSGAAKTLLTAGAGKTFSSLSLSTNQKNGNLIAMLLQTAGSKSSLLGVLLKPNGTLLRSKPLTLQSSTTNFSTTGDASFSDAGIGFGLWSDKTTIKFRKISASLTLGSPAKKILNSADQSSVQTTILFDSRNNQFIAVWGKANQILGAVLNATGSLVKQPFTIASTAGVTAAINVASSYDAQVGNAVAVWEDQISSGSVQKFRPRAAIFFVAGNSSSSDISIGDNFFSPATLNISAGTTVTWQHNGNNNHTVTSNGGLFDSGTLSRGDTFSFRFTDAGSFPYHCLIHGLPMSGTITVTKNNEPPPRY